MLLCSFLKHVVMSLRNVSAAVVIYAHVPEALTPLSDPRVGSTQLFRLLGLRFIHALLRCHVAEIRKPSLQLLHV